MTNGGQTADSIVYRVAAQLKISEFVETITETGATELNKINHTLTRIPKSYCCTKCLNKSQYIHDAEMHNRFHVKEQEKP